MRNSVDYIVKTSLLVKESCHKYLASYYERQVVNSHLNHPSDNQTKSKTESEAKNESDSKATTFKSIGLKNWEYNKEVVFILQNSNVILKEFEEDRP